MYHPGGSHSLADRICRRIEAAGSCKASAEVRPSIATGTGSAGLAVMGSADVVTIRGLPENCGQRSFSFSFS